MNAVLSLLASAPDRHAKCRERELYVDAMIARLKEQHALILMELETLRREAADESPGPESPHSPA
jgi:hypothetical protein